MVAGDFLMNEEELIATDLGPDEPQPGAIDDEYDKPNADFVTKGSRRNATALMYEKKSRKFLNSLFRQAVAHEATVPDAAAIIMYGPEFSEKLGDLAAVDPRVRRGIDMVTGGTENPYLAFAFAAAPFILQVYRNHESGLAPSAIVNQVKTSRAQAKERPVRQFRIPFTKRTIGIRFKLHFPLMANLTNDPDALSQYVFSQEAVLASLEKAGITKVAFNGNAPQKPTRSRSR
jgi:hypothetical protein